MKVTTQMLRNNLRMRRKKRQMKITTKRGKMMKK